MTAFLALPHQLSILSILIHRISHRAMRRYRAAWLATNSVFAVASFLSFPFMTASVASSIGNIIRLVSWPLALTIVFVGLWAANNRRVDLLGGNYLIFDLLAILCFSVVAFLISEFPIVVLNRILLSILTGIFVASVFVQMGFLVVVFSVQTKRFVDSTT